MPIWCKKKKKTEKKHAKQGKTEKEEKNSGAGKIIQVFVLQEDQQMTFPLKTFRNLQIKHFTID